MLMPHAFEALQYVLKLMPSYIVSTSYEPYIRSLCRVLRFPYQNVYCTKLDIDRYVIDHEEAEKLKRFREEVSRMPDLEIPEHARSLEDLPVETRRAVERLNEIFWMEISRMECGEILRDVEPIGGYEKANAVNEIAEFNEVELEDVIYIGDSITDVDSFRLVREGGGLTVSFNGNEYAVREAEVAVVSSSALITALLAYKFNIQGKRGVLELAEGWPENLKDYSGHPLYKRFLEEFRGSIPIVEVITKENRERITKLSSEFRKKVRGEKVGSLG